MKIRILSLLLPALMMLSAGCKNKHFISDKSYREKVEKQFETQKVLAENRSQQLFGVFRQNLTTDEKEALEFLFAFMPLSDLADYDGEFYLQNIRASFAARDTFQWGATIPENIFRHFVLPVRVNNENLDTSRQVFFMELKDRIKKLSMKEAVLEVNHWCHEKVTYRGTDDRTSSPLATVKTAYGRCGEESTFTVAVLRAAGIPARQCYTPRWAHCDDNHAWVEAWVDGHWHYIGACEPDADLDLAWFTGPAKRAMLVNTNVFGYYDGPEDVLVRNARYTRINILANYASTKRIFVRVRDMAGNPADSATVEFQLYNYAEFYPLTAATTDKNGLCSFLTGFGDLVVWTAKGNHFGFRKVTVKNSDTINIVLAHKPGEAIEQEFDLIPPPEIKTEIRISDSLRRINSEKLSFEDRIRANYEGTFIDSAKCWRLAAGLKLDPDTLWNFLRKSRGNWRDLVDFITSAIGEYKPLIYPLLGNLSEKDLRDVSPGVLEDQVKNTLRTGSFPGNHLFASCVLSPRIDNEFLRPFKALLRNHFSSSFIKKSQTDPGNLVQWVKDSIISDNDANYSRAPLSPAGVLGLRVADDHSRDIFFVALCRSFGIVSRLEPATKIPQYFRDGSWIDVHFSKKTGSMTAKSSLCLVNDKANDRSPVYYGNFTIEKYDNGFFRSLDYESDPVMKEFPATIHLTQGPYMIVTGTRIQGGAVLVRMLFTNLGGDQDSQVITFRRQLLQAAQYGKIPDVSGFLRSLGIAEKPGNLGKGLILAWIDAGKEPSRHLAADLILKKNELEKWNGCLRLLFRDKEEEQQFRSVNKGLLTVNTAYGIYSRKHLDEIGKVTGRKITGDNLPLVIYLTPQGEVIYLSEGYRIGTGDDLMMYTRSPAP